MTKIAWNLLLVLFGRGGLLALSLVAYAIVFRTLENQDAGKFAMCILIIRLLADCVGEPLDMAVMREVPLALRTDPDRAIRILRGAFLVRCVVATLIVAVVSVLSPWIAEMFIHDSGDSDLVIGSAIGAAGVLLCRANSAYFQCEEQFSRMIFADAVMQVGRFLGVLGLVQAGLLTARTGILSYVIMTWLSFATSVWFLPSAVRRPTWDQIAGVAVVLRYARWMVGVTLVAAVSERVNEILVARYYSPGELAIYSAAMTLAPLPEFLTGCLSSVYQPRIVSVFREGQFPELHLAYLRYSVPLSVVAICVAMLLARPIILLTFGASYEAAVPVFRLLSIATLGWLALSPLAGILMLLHRPQHMLALNLTMLLTMLVAGYFVIPAFGVVGAAALFLAARTVNLIVILSVTAQLVDEQNASSSAVYENALTERRPNASTIDVTGAEP